MAEELEIDELDEDPPEVSTQDDEVLPNGNKRCAHKCADRSACNHVCCKEGIKKKSKKSTATSGSAGKRDCFTLTRILLIKA